MSSLLMIPIPAIKLARRAWLRLIGLLLLGLLGATALAFYGYQIHVLNDDLNAYKQAASQYRVRTRAIHSLHEMEAAFTRYLLDGSPANLMLIQADKQTIELWAQWDASAQQDKVLQNLVAEEQKWYAQTAQPLIEERKKVPAGQGVPEDLLAKYRASGQGLELMNLEHAMDVPYLEAQMTLFHHGGQLRWLWLPFPLAGLLVIGVIALAIGGMKSVSHLKQAAESEGDEDEDDGNEPPHEQDVVPK